MPDNVLWTHMHACTHTCAHIKSQTKQNKNKQIQWFLNVKLSQAPYLSPSFQNWNKHIQLSSIYFLIPNNTEYISPSFWAYYENHLILGQYGYRCLKILALVHNLISINEVILKIILLWKQYSGHAHRIFQQVNYHQMQRTYFACGNIFIFSTYKLSMSMDDKISFPISTENPSMDPKKMNKRHWSSYQLYSICNCFSSVVDTTWSWHNLLTSSLGLYFIELWYSSVSEG